MKSSPSELSEDERKRFYDLFDETTHPTEGYEGDIIGSIIGSKAGSDVWRFRKGVHCSKCNKELRVLDYFISALKAHSLEFVKKAIASEFKGDPIEIVEHGLEINCLNCGTTYKNKLYNPYYKHPTPISTPRYRLSQEAFMELVSQIQ